MAKKIQYAVNDTEIFSLTGCLSNCDKYHYTAHSRDEQRSYMSNMRSYVIHFMFANGKNEIKEQVRGDATTIYTTYFKFYVRGRSNLINLF